MPQMSLQAVIKLRSELLRTCSFYQYSRLDADLYQNLCRTLARQLKTDESVMQESLLYLQGRLHNRPVFEQLAHRLAANVKRLQAGHPVYPWILQKRKEWVVAQILGAIPRLSSTMEPGAMLTIKLMTGTAAGITIKKWFSLRGCRGLARRAHFPKPKSDKSWDRPKILYRIPDDLVTLRLEVALEAEYSKEEPGFRETRLDKASGSWNREQLRARYRVDRECPRGYSGAVFCHNCTATVKQCRAAVRLEPLVELSCIKCHKKDLGYSVKQSTCVGCLREEGYRYHNTEMKDKHAKDEDMADAVQESDIGENSRVGD